MRHLIPVIALFVCSFGFSQATDLIISEYVEGSSNNKYIELYNGTGATVNLANYRLQLFANGAATPTNNVLLSGTLANGTTIVYKNSAATISPVESFSKPGWGLYLNCPSEVCTKSLQDWPFAPPMKISSLPSLFTSAFAIHGPCRYK